MEEQLDEAKIETERSPANVLAALNSRDRVSGLTHDFYRYPARLSPVFVRAAIDAFSKQGDLVVDPFVGGGTTAVEAIASGRRFLGGDLNELAVFITRAKTTALSPRQSAILKDWADQHATLTSGEWHKASIAGSDGSAVPWNIHRTIQLSLRQLSALRDRRLRRIARASILRTAQWALDGRRELPSRVDFLQKHRSFAHRMAEDAVELGRNAAIAFGGCPLRELDDKRRIVLSDAGSLPARMHGSDKWRSPKLILTSPPYHGVHVLYHRWQVQGRRETNAPYWITATKDGRSASFYTFGPRVRQSAQLRTEYFERALAAFKGIAQLCSPATLIVQVVGFSDPEKQRPLYAQTMRAAGFTEVVAQEHPKLTGAERLVPNRKWYLDALDRETASSKEYLLVHRLT